jgi:hypothetical protein
VTWRGPSVEPGRLALNLRRLLSGLLRRDEGQQDAGREKDDAGLLHMRRRLRNDIRRMRAEVFDAQRALRKELLSELADQRRILQAIYDQEPDNRRRLAALRALPEYEQAFSEAKPLVSIVIATYDNWRGLRDVAIPSVLAQTYERFELVVVGDDAPPETAEVISSFGDDRISFINRERRGPYPADPRAREFVKGDPAFNEGVRASRGRWIAFFADDDAMRPEHIETLIARVRETRAEFCYGRVNWIYSDASTGLVGEWPPDSGKVSLQAALFHHGLSDFIELELADALFQTSSDKSFVRRLLRCGVRFAYVDEVIVDYYSRRAVDRHHGAPQRRVEPDGDRS